MEYLLQVLGILVRAVIEKIPDSSGEPDEHIEHKLRELFGRITSKVWPVFLSCNRLYFILSTSLQNEIGGLYPDKLIVFKATKCCLCF